MNGTAALLLPKDAGDVAEKLSLFSEHWSPKVVTRLNDYEVKVVKLHSEFVWHEPIGVVDEIIDPADTRRLAEPLTAARAGLDARGNILL